jgi:hypothetical protein
LTSIEKVKPFYSLQRILSQPGTISTLKTLLGSYSTVSEADWEQVEKALEAFKSTDFNMTEMFLERFDFGSEMESEILSVCKNGAYFNNH